MQKTAKRLYLIPVLSKALDIFELLQSETEGRTLEALHRKTKISKTTIYRILKTFVHRGYVAQSQDGLYRMIARPKKMRFGFAGQSAEQPFSVAVTESLKAAAAAADIDITILDNCYDGATAIRNAEELLASGVDLIIEFQVEHEVAPIIADRIAAAGIPLIAIDIPHPHATYFGVDNYRVGMEVGEVLANYAKEQWGGDVDWMLGLDLPEAGQLVQSRITGAFEGVRNALRGIAPECFVRMDGRGLRDRSYNEVLKFLEARPNAKRVLVAAATDSSALGALDAARALKREKHLAIMGADCIPEAIKEIGKAKSSFIGSVSHEGGTYGTALVHLGLALLRGQTVAPYNYVTHSLVTRSNLQGR